MKSVDLNSEWNIVSGDDRYVCDLPHDVTLNAPRDYSCAFGQLNGYIPEAYATFTRALPQIKHGDVVLVVSGVCGYGDIFVNDRKIGVVSGRAPNAFYITDELTGSHNELRIRLHTSPAMSDKYLGLGIAGGVSLYIADNDVDIEYNSVFVKTAVASGKTYADIAAVVYNRTDTAKKVILEGVIKNARGKRAGKKQRKVTVKANASIDVTVRVRMSNPYYWSVDDPYIYTAELAAIGGESEEITPVVKRFGIVTRALSSARGLYLNNVNTKLFGAYVSHADEALGCASNYSNEVRRLRALKAVGYNAVHLVGCPTDAMLDACDDVGMLAFVDLASHLTENKTPLDGILEEDTAEAVKSLRNHPSVVLYGIADDVPECYDRNDGHALIDSYCKYIKSLDDTRPVTVSTRELVPTSGELEAAGCKKHVFDNAAAAINAGREKGLFETLTAGAFDAVDVSGFNYLYPLYETETTKRDRLAVGARTSSERAFESIDATEKNDRVIGDFNDHGIDYPGDGKYGEIINTEGDIDSICCEKPQGVYKRILLGERNIAYIVTLDPETNEPVNMWNHPRYLGQKVEIKVYTSGDVVALYLDGRLIGRRLAGKINKHIASFTADYYPGTLEAVAYFKGVECARTTLKTAGTPKTIRLTTGDKNLSVGRKDLGFVQIEVCDRDGNLVPYAMRSLNATVVGGDLVGFINADPMLRKNEFDCCPAYGGRALAVVRPDPWETKAVVKITGEGLLSSKISFKIKN